MLRLPLWLLLEPRFILELPEEGLLEEEEGLEDDCGRTYSELERD